MTTTYHTPALLNETISGLDINPDGIYVDVTFGGGGHSRAILSRLGAGGRLLSFDQDIETRENSIDDNRFTFVHSNFAFLKNFLRYYGVQKVDGILADLGVSSHHFDDPSRGFSFRYDDGLLDMRMNKSGSLDARKVLSDYSEEQLADVFYLYGELRQARRIAHSIMATRDSKPVNTIGDLLAVVRPHIRLSQEKKELAQVFQALRIEVNGEMTALKSLLSQCVEVLNPGGRLAVITYHSLEDRLVKNFIRSGNVDGKIEKDFYGRIITPFKAVNSKVIVPGGDEVEQNPRSRSAKLRIAERIYDA